jgi:hypothetical protein
MMMHERDHAAAGLNGPRSAVSLHRGRDDAQRALCGASATKRSIRSTSQRNSAPRRPPAHHRSRRRTGSCEGRGVFATRRNLGGPQRDHRFEHVLDSDHEACGRDEPTGAGRRASWRSRTSPRTRPQARGPQELCSCPSRSTPSCRAPTSSRKFDSTGPTRSRDSAACHRRAFGERSS